MTRHRSIIFVINNWTELDYKQVTKLPYSYLIVGKEIGKENKTPHLQGYAQFANAISFSKLKKLLPRAKLIPPNGTPEENRTYCMKDGDFIEEGEITEQGKRTDLVDIYDAVKAGYCNTQISDSYPGAYMRFFKSVDRVRLDHARNNKTFTKLTVTVLCGDAGTGKTRLAYEKDPDLYRLMPSDSTIWFDGYTDQKTLLIDDFYGWIKYGYLLQLLDGYKFQLPIKGGFTWKQWENVIITSNHHPSAWYTNLGLTPALERRISKIIKVGDLVLPPTSV